jgi:hypothetical protein
MRQRHLDRVVREFRLLAGPIAERRTEAMDRPRLVIVSPDSRNNLARRQATYRPVQISGAGSE